MKRFFLSFFLLALISANVGMAVAATPNFGIYPSKNQPKEIFYNPTTNQNGIASLTTFYIRTGSEAIHVKSIKLINLGQDAPYSSVWLHDSSSNLVIEGSFIGDQYVDFSKGFDVPAYSYLGLELHANIPEDAQAGQQFQFALRSMSATVISTNKPATGTYDLFSLVAPKITIIATDQIGSLTAAKAVSYPNNTVADPQTAFKIASLTLTAGAVEPIVLTQTTIDFDGSQNTANALHLQNMYIKYGKPGSQITSSVSGNVDQTANTWKLGYELQPNETALLDVYADINQSIEQGEVIQATLVVNGLTANTKFPLTTTKVEAQTFTIVSGIFSVYNHDHPIAGLHWDDQQDVTVAHYRFTAANADYTIKELKTSVQNAQAASVISEVRLYDGKTLVASTIFDEDVGTAGTFTGLSILIPANSSKVLTVSYMLSTVGPGGSASQMNVFNTLESVKFVDSNGIETVEINGTDWLKDSIRGNWQYVFSAVPVVNHVLIQPMTLLNGQTQDLYEFTVTAMGGSVALKQIKLTVNWYDGATADTLEIESLKLWKNGSDVTSTVTLLDEDGNSVKINSGLQESDEDLVITWPTEELIAEDTTVTYTLRGVPTGFRMTNTDPIGSDVVSFSLAMDDASNGVDTYLNSQTNQSPAQWQIAELYSETAPDTAKGQSAELIWSDLSASLHSSAPDLLSSDDWHNGFLVQNLDLPKQTWMK